MVIYGVNQWNLTKEVDYFLAEKTLLILHNHFQVLWSRKARIKLEIKFKFCVDYDIRIWKNIF